MQMLEAGGGRTRALLGLNRQHILPSCAELKDSQPTLPSWGRTALHTTEFCLYPGRTQNEAFDLMSCSKKEKHFLHL